MELCEESICETRLCLPATSVDCSRRSGGLMVAHGDAGAERSSTRRLHIGGLSPDVLETDVAQLFAPFGKVRTIELVRDAETAGCRGFAYVSLEATDEQVNKCFKDYARAKWRGRHLTVAQARPSYLERLQAEWDEARLHEIETAEKLAAVPEWQEAVAPASEWTELSIRRGYAAPLIVVKPGVTNQHCWSPKGEPLLEPSHSQSQPYAGTSEDEEKLEAEVTATVQQRGMKSVRLETAPPLKSVLKPTSSWVAAPKAAINRSLLRADLAAELDEELAEAAGLDVQLFTATLPARRAFGVAHGAVGRGREEEDMAEDDEYDTAQPWVDQGEEEEEHEEERKEEEQQQEEEAEADEDAEAAEAEGKVDEHYGDDEGITTEETDMALSVLASLLRPKPAVKAIKPGTGDKGAPTKRPLSGADQPSPAAPRGVRMGAPSSGSGGAGSGSVDTAAAPVERSRTLTVAEQAAEERKARYGQWASSKVWQVGVRYDPSAAIDEPWQIGVRYDPSAAIDEPEPYESPQAVVGKQKAVLSGRSEAEKPPTAKKAEEPPKGKQTSASPAEEAPTSIRSSLASGPTHRVPDANVLPKRKEAAVVGARRSTRAKEPKPEPEQEPEPEPEPTPEPPKKKAKGDKAKPEPESEDKPSEGGDPAGSGASKIVDVKGGGSLRSLFLGAASTAGFSLMGSGFSFGGAFDGGGAATALATPAISEASAAPSFDSTAPWTTAEVWAAPPMQAFMRKASEEDLRENWVAGRRDARSAYKKRHQDAVRQQKLLHGQRRGRSMRSSAS